MKRPEIMTRLPKFKLPNILPNDAQVILRLVTILAATHLANKVDRIIRDLDKLDDPNDFIRIFK